ncbi:MAG: hypothetical protein H0T89_15340 [Deltaproteobacteria bacterium]|nr:hypothetical protein [Deltaproteobacteria bacterium]
MASDPEVWHLVEARRDDGSPTMFRIRELEPRLDQPRIFVVELPYPATELSRMPDASAYRRLTIFEEQWLAPACSALGWTPVAIKIADGSFFVYLYGNTDSLPMIERLSPFDGGLGFFEEADPAWDEYAALKELLDEAKAITPDPDPEPDPEPDGSGFDADTVLQHWTDQAVPDAVPVDAGDHTQTTVPVARSRSARPTTAAKHAAKQPAAKQPAATEPAATEPAVTEPAATLAPKQPGTKTAAKKVTAKKPAAKKSAVKKPTKKPAATKPAAKKPAAKKPAAKKPTNKPTKKPAKKPAAKQSTAKGRR